MFWFISTATEVKAATETTTATITTRSDSTTKEKRFTPARRQHKVSVDILFAKLFSYIETNRSVIIINITFVRVGQY
jgi:hypothetical protein